MAAGLQRHEKIGAAGVKSPGTGNAGVVEVDAGRVVLGQGTQVDARADGSNGALEVQGIAVAQLAAQNVVLLGRHPGRQAVGRYRRGAQVVGHTAALHRAVGLVAVPQYDGASQCYRAGGHGPDFTTHELAVHGGLHRRRALTRHRCAHKAGHQHQAAICIDCQVTRVVAHRKAGQRRAVGVQLQQPAGGFQAHIQAFRGHSGWRSHNAVRLRGKRHDHGFGNGAGGCIDLRQCCAVAVGHPDFPVDPQKGQRSR